MTIFMMTLIIGLIISQAYTLHQLKIMDTNVESYVVDIVNEVLQEFIDTQSESNDPKVLN